MQNSPKLLQQGLILILVPLLFELGFIGILTCFLDEVEGSLAAEKQSLMLMSHGHNLLQQFIPLGKALYTFRNSDDDRMMKIYRKKYSEIQSELATMADLADNHRDAEERQDFERVRFACQKMLHELDVLSQAMLRREAYTGYGGKQRQASLKSMVALLDEFIRKEKERGQRLHSHTGASRRIVKTTLYAGWFLNLLMAVGLVVYFARSTTKRLQVVYENAIRLGAGQSLLSPVKGNDEIAQLDRVFHDMADALHAAAKLKKELVQMVSHDLRTPLASIKISMETLNAGVFGTLPESAGVEVNKCMHDADYVINLANELLEGERREAASREEAPADAQTP